MIMSSNSYWCFARFTDLTGIYFAVFVLTTDMFVYRNRRQRFHSRLARTVSPASFAAIPGLGGVQAPKRKRPVTPLTTVYGESTMLALARNAALKARPRAAPPALSCEGCVPGARRRDPGDAAASDSEDVWIQNAHPNTNTAIHQRMK